MTARDEGDRRLFALGASEGHGCCTGQHERLRPRVDGVLGYGRRGARREVTQPHNREVGWRPLRYLTRASFRNGCESILHTNSEPQSRPPPHPPGGGPSLALLAGVEFSSCQMSNGSQSGHRFSRGQSRGSAASARTVWRPRKPSHHISQLRPSRWRPSARSG